MLFAAWEVRIVKNCDRVKNCNRGPYSQNLWPRSQFFTIPTYPKPANNLFVFSCDKLAYNWVYKTLLLNWFKCRLQTSVKNLTNERASKLRRYTKKDVLKNRLISNCVMLVASNSPVKFSKSVFPIVKFRAKFDWSCTTNTISISRCVSLEIRPFYRKLSSRKRGNSLSVLYRTSLKYSNDQRG